VVWCQPAPPAAAAVDPALWRAELAEVRALRAVILAHIGPFMRSASMEVAERACHLAALLNLLALAESMEADQVQCPNPTLTQSSWRTSARSCAARAWGWRRAWRRTRYSAVYRSRAELMYRLN
jgi:hypothetical protein